jgi:multimeric flavodoxin WrbA
MGDLIDSLFSARSPRLCVQLALTGAGAFVVGRSDHGPKPLALPEAVLFTHCFHGQGMVIAKPEGIMEISDHTMVCFPDLNMPRQAKK